MPARIGRLSAGVGRRHPVTTRKASLMAGRWGDYEHCGTKQERSTLRLNAPVLGHAVNNEGHAVNAEEEQTPKQSTNGIHLDIVVQNR